MLEQAHKPRGLRQPAIVAGLILGTTLLGIATAQARKHKPQGPPADLVGHVAYLANQLYGQHLEDSEDLTNEIQKLVVAHLEKWIESRSPSPLEVRREIERVFSKVRYPAYAQATVFEAPWKGEVLIGAAYTLGWSDIWRRNVVVLFANRNGHTQKVALTTFVPRTNLHYLTLPPSASGAFRFIIYGSRLGKSHPRLTAVLYSFNGKNLEPSWKVQDMFDGQLSIRDNELVISYLNEDEFIRETAAGHYPPRHQIIYKITPQGLELAGQQQVPF